MSLKNFKLFFVSSWSHTLNKGAVRWGDDGGGGGAGAGEGGEKGANAIRRKPWIL